MASILSGGGATGASGPPAVLLEPSRGLETTMKYTMKSATKTATKTARHTTGHTAMRRTFVASVLSLSLVGFSLAAAAPTTLGLNDAGIDFGDASSSTSDTAYLSFQMQDGQLVARFSDHMGSSAIPAVKFFVPGTQGTDIAGNDVDPTLADIADVSTTRYGNELLSVMVTHPDTSLADATSAYLSSLQALGFTVDAQEHVGVNIDVLNMSNGDENVRLVLHRVGSDVTAFLTGV